MYALIINGEIVGTTRWPNETSSTPVDESSVEWIAFDLEKARKAKIAEIKDVAISRISSDVPAIDTPQMIDLLVEIWPGLNTASLGADILAAQATYVYAISKINQARGATQAQLDAYDPATDPGWP